MDFFDRQDHARRRTGLLIVLFAASVICIIATLYLISAGAWQYYVISQAGPRVAEAPPVSWWNPTLALVVTAGVLLIVGGGTAYKTVQLSGGGPTVARLLGGRPIDPGSKDPRERRLLNVVEEMSVASGTPVPAVFVLDGEQGINAFAAGFSTRDAAIAVTEGTMTLLSRDELQGVVAHEFSHVLNGDMRMNLRLLGVLHGILLIGLTGLTLLRMLQYVRVRGKKGGGAIGAILGIGLTLTVIGYIGLFFGKLIKSAISRQREFLADAAAVQFTRNPDGIGGALKKIGGCHGRGRLLASNAEEASHLYIANALGDPLFGWMATHPPLPQRIRAIDPRWDGAFPDVAWPETPEVEGERPRRQGLEAIAPALVAGAALEAGRIAIVPDAVASRVGTVTPEQVSYGAALLAAIPEPLSDAAHDPVGARALVYALLLDADAGIRAQQQASAQEDAEASAAMSALEPHVASLGPESRLPLVDIALPALKTLPPETTARFDAIVRRLIEADERVSLSEFALQKILRRHLDGARPERARYYAVRAVLPETSTLLSALAHAGADDPEAARRAFATGARRLGLGNEPVPFLSRGEATLAAVDAALDKLSFAAPGVKRLLLRAGAECIACDGTVTRDEAELLRAVSDTLDCPMPPFGGAAN